MDPQKLIFKTNSTTLVQYKSIYIDISTKSCTCPEYLDKAVCPDLIACSKYYGFELRGYVPTRTLVVKKRRGRPAKQALTMQIN